MTTLVKMSAFGDVSLPFDTEPSAFNPVVTCANRGGEPGFLISATGANFFGKSPLGSPATISFRFAITLSALPTASNPIFAPLTSGNASAWRIRLGSAGTLILDNSSNTAVITTPAMTVGTTYLFKVRITATSMQVRMYGAIRGGAQVGTDMSATNTFGLADNFRIGQALGTPIVPPYNIQHLLITDTDEWLPDPAVPTATTAPARAVIGDSNTARMSTQFHSALFGKGISPRDVYFWGVGGKRISVPDTASSSNGNANAKTSMQNVQDAKNLYGTVDHWILALGTNDRPYTDAEVNGYIDTLLAAVGQGPKVTWVGLTSKGSASPDDIRVNNLIRAKIAARPNSEFADWDARIRAVDGGDVNSPLWLTTDTTHMSPAGYEVRAAFYADIFAPPSSQPWSNVYVGSTLATGLYIGSTKVWP